MIYCVEWFIKSLCVCPSVGTFSAKKGTEIYVRVGTVIDAIFSLLKHNSIACVQQSTDTAYSALKYFAISFSSVAVRA